MKVLFKKSFLKSITKLRNSDIKQEIVKAIENIENASNIKEINDLKKLKGYKDCYRIKINNFRIGIKIIDSEVFFVDVDQRKDIYKRFP